MPTYPRHSSRYFGSLYFDGSSLPSLLSLLMSMLHHAPAMFSFRLSFGIFSTLLATVTKADLQFFPDGLTADNNVSSTCIAALTATVNACPSSFLLYPVTDFGGPFTNMTSQASFCSTACSNALASYHNSVSSACASDRHPWDGIPANFSGDRMAAYQKRMCLKDPKTGQYCIGKCLVTL